jgi:hypothetical protein
MLQRTQYPHSPLGWGFPIHRIHCCGRLPPRVKYASSVRGILSEKELIHSVDVVTIRKTGSVESDRLEADVRSGSSSMDAVDHHEVLRGLVWDILNSRAVSRELLHGSRAKAGIMASSCLVSVQSVGDLHSRVPQVLQFLSHGEAVPIVETH